MNIFIGTDSRGTHPLPDGGWTQKLISKYPKHSFVTCRSSIEAMTFTIYLLDPLLLNYPDGHFDIAFIQAGYNEGIEYWSENVYKQMMGTHFNPIALTKQVFHQKRYKGYAYIYIDREAEKKIFDLLKQKSKRVVFIGIHSNLLFRKLWNLPYDENTKEMLKVLPKLATDYIELPQDQEWVDANVHWDGIHYKESGAHYILGKVEKFLDG